MRNTGLILTLTCTSPLSHSAFGDGNIGNATMFRREPIVSLPGFPRVPVVSGNALRGVTRRFLMREILAAAGLSREVLLQEKTGARAWDRLYAALCNGGTIEEAEKRILPEELREWREKLPALSLLGSALYTSLMPGVCQIGFLWPACEQTVQANLIQSDRRVLPDAEDLITEVGVVRHIEREEQTPDFSGVTPMPVTIEALATGTMLQSVCTFSTTATEIERSCLAHGLENLTHIGGKSGSGFGAVNVALEGGSGELYREWLTQKAGSGELRASLLALAAKVA